YAPGVRPRGSFRAPSRAVRHGVWPDSGVRGRRQAFFPWQHRTEQETAAVAVPLGLPRAVGAVAVAGTSRPAAARGAVGSAAAVAISPPAGSAVVASPPARSAANPAATSGPW